MLAFFFSKNHKFYKKKVSFEIDYNLNEINTFSELFSKRRLLVGLSFLFILDDASFWGGNLVDGLPRHPTCRGEDSSSGSTTPAQLLWPEKAAQFIIVLAEESILVKHL